MDCSRPSHPLHLASRTHLREKMRLALATEDYEQATEIRDELQRREAHGEPVVVTSFGTQDEG